MGNAWNAYVNYWTRMMDELYENMGKNNESGQD